MAEAAQDRMRHEVSTLVEELDRSLIRPLQRSMHLCAAECCQDSSSSMESVQLCVSKCSKNVASASATIQEELSNYQGRINRCAMDCEDKVKDSVPANAKADQLDRYRSIYEGCVVKCIDTATQGIPSLTTRIKDRLKSTNY